ncbi:MAG: ABC transporter permease [Tissierellales bacterium]|jgi:peptide/nickel transport system permease protein|nr:ABC transporter permease [Tissierellales bacterium]
MKSKRLYRLKQNFKKIWFRFSTNKVSILGLVLVTIIILLAIFAPIIIPYPKHVEAFVDYNNASLPPGDGYLLGTDQYGRDLFSRIIFAFRGALKMGLGVLFVSVPIGVLLGLIAGYYKGTWIEDLIMRIVDIFLALPPLILALAVSTVLKPTLFNSMMAVCVAWWAWYARISYSMASSIKNEYYIQSAELIGARPMHILIKEILPNCTGSILTKMTLDMGWVILIGASLSFVGMGEQPPAPALGTMVADGVKYLPNLWWLAVFPGLAILIIVLSFNLLGDGIGDIISGKDE